MWRYLSLVLFLSAIALPACRSTKAPDPTPHGRIGAAPKPTSSPAPVSQFDEDGNMTGTRSNPMPVTGTINVTADGGVALATAVTIINDAGVPVPTNSLPGDLLNSVAKMVTPGTQLNVKGSAGTLVRGQFCNVADAGLAYWNCYDQATPDAGGLINAGTVANRMTPPVPPGTCGSLPGATSFASGLQCYVSLTPATLSDAGVPPNFIAEEFFQ